MGWFDEQIRMRKQTDDTAFSDSFKQIAGAVMGRRLTEGLNNDLRKTEDAIGEILRYYRAEPGEVPESITDINEILEYLMRPHGIMRRTVRLEKGWYKDAAGAMIGTKKEDGSVVALLPSPVAGYRYYDRSLGKFVRINSKNQDMIDKEAIAFYRPFPLEKMGVMSLIKYIWEQISIADLVILCITMAAVTGVGFITPWLNAELFSDVLASKQIMALVGCMTFMLCASLTGLLFGVVKALASSRIDVKLSVNVQAAAMMRMLSLPATFFKDYSAGELSNRLQYVESLADQLVNMCLSTTLSSLFSLAYIAQIFVYAPGLVAPAMLVTLATIAVTMVTVFIQTKITRKQMLLLSKESGISYAVISGIQKIRLAGAEKRAFGKWAKAYSDQAKLLYNPPIILKVSQVMITGISLIGSMIMFYEAIHTNVSYSEYFAFNAAYGQVSMAFMALGGIVTSIAQIKPILEMVRPFLETVPEVAEDKEMVTRLSGGIELNNITFRYSDDMPAVIDDLTLKIRPGQYVAIVGKTGCGKSTLMRIMLGFETPQKGAVFYDGKDLKRLDLKSLRRKIGSVMQNGKLFTGDIYSNIVIAAPWLSLADAWEAAKIAGLDDDIRNMPMGMNTLIAEGSGGISGGQKQRLLIARAVAPKPRILIFDEATSALDNITQRQVSEALDRMKCTRVIIAHRLSTIRQCDRIIVLEGGKIIEDGTYDELIAKQGFFADLVSRQQLEENGDCQKEQSKN